MKNFVDSLVLKTMRSLADSTFTKAFRDIQNSPSMKAMLDLQNSPSMKAMLDLQESPVMRAIQAIDGSSTMGVFSAMADRLSSLNAGPLTFSEAWHEIIRKYEIASHTNVLDPLEAVVSEVEEQARRPSKGPLGTEFFLNLILALFLFCYSQILANESEQHILHRIERMEYIVSQQLAELNAHEDIDTFYIVERSVTLRTRSNTKSKIIALLHPNLKVRLIEKGSKWIKVEYFDYLEGVHRSGWVHKKYLKIMNPRKSIDRRP